MKKGFTLLELIIVVGIIGVLAGVMMATFGGSTASARSAQCMANMRNLTVAAQNFGMDSGIYPYAGSWCDNGRYEDGRRKYVYYSYYGWISWVNDDWPKAEDAPWRSQWRTQKVGNSSMVRSTYAPAGSKEDATHLFAITNGALWSYAGKNRQGYVCPEHRLVCNKKKVRAGWSYVLNGYFGYDTASLGGNAAKCAGRSFGSLKYAERTLLFAELPFVQNDAHSSISFSTANGDPAVDCTLQFDDGKSRAESIGFNHKHSNRLVAHVSFADGHVEKLVAPSTFDSSKAEELTKWLCTGILTTFDGNRYSEAKE